MIWERPLDSSTEQVSILYIALDSSTEQVSILYIALDSSTEQVGILCMTLQVEDWTLQHVIWGLSALPGSSCLGLHGFVKKEAQQAVPPAL